MKSFKQYIEAYDFSKTFHMGLNHPGEIKDFPHEARRQLKLFTLPNHNDTGSNNPPKPISDKWLKSNGLSRNPPSIDHIEKSAETIAMHLDNLHKEYPEIAKHWNMRPMSPENIEDDSGYESPHR
jgi:hypothetical protein